MSLYTNLEVSKPMKLILAVGIFLCLIPPALSYVVYRFGCQEMQFTAAVAGMNEGYSNPFTAVPCTPNAPWVLAFVIPCVLFLLYLPVPFVVLLSAETTQEEKFQNALTIYLITLFVFLGIPAIVAPGVLASYAGEDPQHTLLLAFWGLIVYVPSLLSLLSFGSFRYLVVEKVADKRQKLATSASLAVDRDISVIVEGEEEKEKEKERERREQEEEREEELLKNKKIDVSFSSSPPLGSATA